MGEARGGDAGASGRMGPWGQRGAIERGWRWPTVYALPATASILFLGSPGPSGTACVDKLLHDLVTTSPSSDDHVDDAAGLAPRGRVAAPGEQRAQGPPRPTTFQCMRLSIVSVAAPSSNTCTRSPAARKKKPCSIEAISRSHGCVAGAQAIHYKRDARNREGRSRSELIRPPARAPIRISKRTATANELVWSTRRA